MNYEDMIEELDRLDNWFREFDRQPYEMKQNDIARNAYAINTSKYIGLKSTLKAEFGEGAWWN